MDCITGSEVLPAVEAGWRDFLRHARLSQQTALYDVCSFGDTEPLVAELTALVLAGTKRATASLEWEYADSRPPAPGDLSVAKDWYGAPVLVFETTRVDIVPFNAVDADFAAAEGEGDSSLAFWRDAHRHYFQNTCKGLGREFHDTTPVVCEHFRVVHEFTAAAR